MDGQAAMGEPDGKGSGESGFADAALAHDQDEAVAVGGDLVDERGEAGGGDLDGRGGAVSRGGLAAGEQVAQGVESDEIERFEW